MPTPRVEPERIPPAERPPLGMVDSSVFVNKVEHNDFLEQEAVKEKGAFIQAISNNPAKPKLFSLAHKAWRRHSPQEYSSWTELTQTVLNGFYGQKWPDAVFQVPDSCAICLSTMHWPEKKRIVVIYFTCVACYNTWT
ncbi:hypothetical protein TNCV_4851701 [Trichonephila clavipes]|nr:hypothetical protein TNCV_4851701 [Trichonephila clavipes]